MAALEHTFSIFGFRKSLEDLKSSKQQEIEVREDITYMKCYIDWRVTLCLANLLVSLSSSRTLAFIRDLEILRRRRVRDFTEPASFWRENVIVVILLRVLARMSQWQKQVIKC